MVSFDQAARAFAEIYRHDHWEAGSGIGSMVEYARPYVELISAFARNNAIRSVVDVGCGDWQFSRLIDWDGIHYQGFDVVAALVEANNKRFARDNISFRLVTQLNDLPPADLVLCKDVLQHLPLAEVKALLDYFQQNYRFALVTNDIFPDGQTNAEIRHGGWRALRFDLEPFNIRAPILLRYEVRHGDRRWIKDVCLIVGQQSGVAARQTQDHG
jgi:SAM-dependent methyltransferase